MIKAQQYLDYKSLNVFYYLLINPYFIYCIEQGNTYKCLVLSLSVIQKRAMRVIHNLRYTEHINPLFIYSEILKLGDVILLFTICIKCIRM